MRYLDWRLLPFSGTVNAASAYHGAWQPGLVVLSVAIAILASCVALSTSGRIVAANTRYARLAWSAAGAISMGGGIWSMHFIGMLAFSLPCGVSYDPLGTILSIIPGVLASGVALATISRPVEPGLARLSVSAVLMGGGIGAMHYAGMAAMRPDALLLYDPTLVALSVIVAILLAYVSLTIRFRLYGTGSPRPLQLLIAGAVMGCAVSGMHYMAMEASVFSPLAGLPYRSLALPRMVLALAIVTVMSVIALIMLVAIFVARQAALTRTLRAEIARRQELERGAETARARIQAILDGVADGIATIDCDGAIRQWSSGAQRLFGYTAEEVLGEDITMLMPEPHRTRHHRYIGAFLATHDPKIIGIGRELSAIRKDGSEFPIDLTVNQVQTDEGILFTGVLRDITERKRSEAALIQARQQAEAANVAKSQFLATMSHEIRTPMNGVIGMANLLAATQLSERQRRLVSNLSRSGQALLGIINDILDFSRIEAGRLELFETDFDPSDVLADVTNLFCERCTAKGLELVCFVSEDVPTRLRGDPVRLRQVLINLVGNAIKFTERGEVLVEATVVAPGDGDMLLSFAVEDTGIGIEAAKRDSVFESFQQADNSMTRSRGGSGLGLAICRQLIELMGGTIGVESELGRGSRFHFTVRCKLAATHPAEPRRIERPLRVLLVDTNAVSAHVMSLYLASWKVDATLASDAIEAEQAATRLAEKGEHFDVAIVDAKGLRSAGIELAHRLHTDKRTRIILLIGMDSALSDATLDAVGAVAMLTKPARPSELFDALAFIASDSYDAGVAGFAMRSSALTERPQFEARILVAEDNPVNQDVITGLLEAMGCHVVTAPNGRSAVQRHAQEKFDLILMDCEMPLLDGFQATGRIRALEQMGASEEQGAQRRTPIVALTAHALSDVRARCLEAGMDDFLVKPFDEEQVTAALRRWIGALERAPKPRKPVAASRGPAIDSDAIQKIRAMDRHGDDALLKRVVSQFLAAAPTLVATMHAKFAAGDGEALWRAAHSLKSSAAALGARGLSQYCADIETLTRETGPEAVKGLLNSLDAELAAAIDGLQQAAGVAS
ncbi:MAG TPA: MHYT domain-containing protein [Acetobacteraceae bacterium]|jgi:PAS domain S-box-containing protein